MHGEAKRLATYSDECVPSLPEIRVGDQADSFTELGLDGGRAGNHEPNKLLFDGPDLVFRELVVSLAVLLGEESLVSRVGRKRASGHRHTT